MPHIEVIQAGRTPKENKELVACNIDALPVRGDAVLVLGQRYRIFDVVHHLSDNVTKLIVAPDKNDW